MGMLVCVASKCSLWWSKRRVNGFYLNIFHFKGNTANSMKLLKNISDRHCDSFSFFFFENTDCLLHPCWYLKEKTTRQDLLKYWRFFLLLIKRKWFGSQRMNVPKCMPMFWTKCPIKLIELKKKKISIEYGNCWKLFSAFWIPLKWKVVNNSEILNEKV